MRSVLACCLLLLLIPGLTFADTSDVPRFRPAPVRDFLAAHLHPPAFQVSLFSYKPELGSLTDILQSFGVSRIPGELLPTFSVVLEHNRSLDSRFELGYWQMELDIPPPTSAYLSV